MFFVWWANPESKRIGPLSGAVATLTSETKGPPECRSRVANDALDAAAIKALTSAAVSGFAVADTWIESPDDLLIKMQWPKRGIQPPFSGPHT